ncbi:hypothetical protein [Burkholderia plantarii]|uniref:hypothetical protein n=1 Tax=Burkholderia plantarii TaxID=41899 RepID=UPI0005AEF66E|nr:hypothetical protein [Burkholderia plantarii]
MKLLMTSMAILAGVACCPLAQAGQGGNAHGAATAGMTYHGDPVSGPTSPLTPPSRMAPDERRGPPAAASMAQPARPEMNRQ